jgi:hypothetical protein
MDPFHSRRQRRIEQDAMTREQRRDWVVWGTGDRAALFDDYWRQTLGAGDEDVVASIVKLDPDWAPAPDGDGGDDRPGAWMLLVRGATEAEIIEEVAGPLGAVVRGFRRVEVPVHVVPARRRNAS